MGLLNLLICMLFVFLVFSIAVSGLLEWWAQFRGLRGKWLLLGLRRLIGDEDIAKALLQHPLISGLYRKIAEQDNPPSAGEKSQDKPPSYVDPANFSMALAAVVQSQAAGADNKVPPALTYDGLLEAARKLAAQDSTLAKAVLPILGRANGSLAAALKGLEDWFNAGMTRVGGWYKAAAQRRLFAVGLFAAVLFNVDTIAIFRALAAAPEATAAFATRVTDALNSGKVAGVDVGIIAQGKLTPQQTEAIVKWALPPDSARIPLGYGCIAAIYPADTGAASTKTGNTAPATPAATTPATTTPATTTPAATPDTTTPAAAPDKATPAATPATTAPGTSKAGTRDDSLLHTAQACIAEFRQQNAQWSLSDWLVKLLGWALTALAGTLGAPYWFGLLSQVVGLRGSGAKPGTAAK